MLRLPTTASKRQSLLLLAIILLPCALMVCSAMLAYRSEQRVQNGNLWVNHTLEVMARIKSFEGSIAEAESAQRSYLLTHLDHYPQAFVFAQGQVLDHLERLRRLTADNPIQQAHLSDPTPQVTGRLRLAHQTMELEQAGQHETALQIVRAGASEQIMSAIRQISAGMLREEQVKLERREQIVLDQTHQQTGYCFSMVVANVSALAALFFLVRRLRKLESLVSICAWSRTVEYRGHWLSFEEYLQQRFGLNTSHGISPTEAAKLFSNLSKDSGDGASTHAVR